MAATKYPLATWKGDGDSGGTYTGLPYRVVLHTTETSGMPGYASGASAPHLTYDPKAHKWTQHTLLSTAARALANPSGGVQTNRANAIQVEIIAYSAKSIADQSSARLWVGHMDDQAYADLQAFIKWCGVQFGVKNVWPGKQALSYAQANASGFRMSGATWNSFNGVCAHQHVPENTHWDTGALNWNKLMTEDDDVALTPKEQEALNYMVAALASKSTDAPRWGLAFWERFKKIWGSPPGPASPVTHLQLAFVWAKLKADIAAIDASTSVDTVARQEAAKAHTRLDKLKDI